MAKVEALIRIRPLSKEERGRGVREGWSKIGERGIIQHLNQNGVEVSAQAMFFDWVFGPEENNSSVFDRLTPIIDKVLDGSNICVLAYGQTSSGKTHTMRGSLEGDIDLGIIPRAISRIFCKKQAQPISLSFIEVYNECVYDLFGDVTESLQVREMQNGETYIKDALEIEAATEKDAHSLFMRGDRSRRIGTTKMNRESSRSHAVLKIRIGKGNKASTAVFVDLAGSERHKQALTEGKTLKEGGHINKSLLTLSTVISKLSQKHAHIPFRDAKLTRILQPSLTEGSITVLICAVSPTPKCTEETLSTLSLATRAKNIDIRPCARSPRKGANRIHRLYKGIKGVHTATAAVKDKLAEAKEIAGILEKEISILNKQNIDNLDKKTELQKKTVPPNDDLSGILAELRDTKAKNLEKLSELSSSVEYLLQQEKYLSQNIYPPPPISVLMQHLIEGDKMIVQQREQIRQLLAEKEKRITEKISKPSISLALELDRLKKEHQKEKRVLQLRIAQLEVQIQNKASFTSK